MNRLLAASLVVVGLSSLPVSPAPAAVNVERQGSENAMVEVARSTFYGALAGTVVGGAIALAADSGGEPVKWGFVVGTFAGLGYGLYQVSNRPAASLLELDGGVRIGGLAAIAATPGGLRVRAVGLRF